MKKPSAILLLCLALVVAGGAAEFSQATSAIEERVTESVKTLSELTETIEAEKVPLVRERNNLEALVIQLRQEVEALESLRIGRDALLQKEGRELKAREDEINYVKGAIVDYARNFESRVHIAEVQRYASVVGGAKGAIEDGNLSELQKLERQLPLVEIAALRLKGLVGGEVFTGEVLGVDGRVREGEIAVLGPVALFAASDGTGAGTVELVLGSPEPTLLAVDRAQSGAIATIVSTKSGVLPVDASGGLARKMEETHETLLEQWQKGGPVMVAILGLGFVSLLVGLYKWLQIGRIRQPAPRDVEIILEHVRAGRVNNAMDLAESIGGPAGRMLRRAIENASEDKELLEEMLYEQMLDTRPRLEKLMPLIALTAATAPLLGLLGTVTGMINTFKLISVFGTGDPRMLSSGISEALITTMYGLIVAIPALLLHAVISRKAKGVLGSMEQAAVAFINGTSMSGHKGRGPE